MGKFKLFSKHLASSIIISAAILSIANIDTLVHEQGRDRDFAKAQMQLAKERLRQRLEESSARNSKPRGQTNILRESLAQDEFGEILPFASLSTLDPLAKVFEKGVKSFERTVFRGPDYQGESGYDLVQYEIEHFNGSKSSVLAYLDRPALTLSRNVGDPDVRVPVVVIMEARGEIAAYSLYRSGNLVEQSKIPSEDMSDLVARRISSSIPYLSVSR